MGSALVGRLTPNQIKAGRFKSNQIERVNKTRDFGKNKITLELGVLGPYYVVGPALGLEPGASTGGDRANQGS